MDIGEGKSVNGTKPVLVKHTRCQGITRNICFYRLAQGQYYHMYKCLTARPVGESQTLSLRNLLKTYYQGILAMVPVTQ